MLCDRLCDRCCMTAPPSTASCGTPDLRSSRGRDSLLYAFDDRSSHHGTRDPRGDQEYISPTWSPDGKSLAYRVGDPGNQSRICIRSVDGGSERTILTQKKFLDVLSWSPDGKSLALSVLQNGNVDLALYDLTRDKLTPITSDPANDISPSWSPDGKWIAFSSQRSGSSEIWLENLQTPELRQLTRDGGNGFPSFSFAGDRIAWTRQSDGIHLLDLKSGETKRLSSPSEVFYRPAWNRDGRCLAVTADRTVEQSSLPRRFRVGALSAPDEIIRFRRSALLQPVERRVGGCDLPRGRFRDLDSPRAAGLPRSVVPSDTDRDLPAAERRALAGSDRVALPVVQHCA